MAVQWTAFRRNLQETLGVSASQSLRLGLAVSGGVDSMALAYLCSKLQSAEPLKFSFRALIIDHRARPRSRRESELVSRYLHDIGIASQVISLDWGSDANPLSLGNFESRARTLRYRAIGRACCDHKLNAVLLGHHEDDQAETVLMRLVEQRYGPGLQAMKRKAQIPECSDIFGVGESSSIDCQVNIDLHESRRIAEHITSWSQSGVSMVRPLLNLSKQDLVEICKSSCIPWVEDLTNQDRTLTLRNTVRHLLQGGCLPTALQKYSLIPLSEKIHHRRNEQRARAINALNMLESCSLDPRTGKFVFRIPSFMMINPKQSYNDRPLLSFAEYCILTEMICHIVSPRSIFQAEVLEHVAKMLFFRPLDADDDPDDFGQPKKAFTAALVLWIPRPSKEHNLNTWTISRQPPTKREQQSSELRVSKDNPDPIQQHILFDGRFWITVSAKGRQLDVPCMKIRFLRPEDISTFKAALGSEKEKRFFSKTMREAAPGRIRWTLPVAVGPLDEQPLAMPTLGLVSASVTPNMSLTAHYKMDLVQPWENSAASIQRLARVF